MNRMLKGAVRMTSAVALSGGLLAAAALPAAAAAPNQAYAASATGLISLSPVAVATFPGTSPASVASINAAGLLTTGLVTDTAGPTSASSRINDAAATLSGTASLTAGTLTSACLFDTNTGAVTGNAGITNGAVTVAGIPAIPLDASPAPNTTVTVPGIASVILNRQQTAADGTLTVTAIHVSLLGSTQTLDLGVSVCNAASLAPVPILPGTSLKLTLGGLGLLLIGGTAYQVSKRRKAAGIAA